MSFRDFLANQLQPLRKWSLTIALVMYTLFAVMDYVRFPADVAYYTIPLRSLLVIIPLAIALFLSIGNAPKRLGLFIGLMLFIFLAAGLLHSVIFVLVEQENLAFSQLGLVLILMYGCLYTGLPVKSAAAISTVILVVHFAASQAFVGTPINGALFDSTIFALVALLCCGTNYVCQSILRSNYRLQRQLYKDTINDSLTGIYNRRFMMEQAERLIKQARRDSRAVAVVMVDVDNFKNLNDRMGHQTGDALLKQLADVLSNYCRRPNDFVARYGGDEFFVLFYDIEYDKLEKICDSILDAAATMPVTRRQSAAEPISGVSIGATFANAPMRHELKGLLQQADDALYTAKKNGRNRHHIDKGI